MPPHLHDAAARRAADEAGGGTSAGHDPASTLLVRQMVVAIVVVRAAQVAMAVAVTVVHAGDYRNLAVVVALLAATAGWTGLWALAMLRGTRRVRAWLYVDVAVTLLLHFTVAGQLDGIAATSWPNWSNLITLGTCLTLGAVLRPAPALTLATLLGVSYYTATRAAVDASLVPAAATANQIGNSASFVAFTAIALVVVRQLGNAARALDRARAEYLTAERARARLAATQAERTRQYRLLHDTVLATLSALSRSGGTDDVEQIRQRCARDAEILRNLLVADEVTAQAAATHADGSAAALLDAVRVVVDEHTASGLRVHLLPDLHETSVADHVITAFAGAAREALNNVARHASTGQAWVRVRTRPEAVSVTVVDRGVGFPLAGVAAGWGLRQSIGSRLLDVGATHNVTSAPGDGTVVEMKWTP